MFKTGKTAMILAITLSVLGTSAALAGGKDDDGWNGGGFRVGSQGQIFSGDGNPAYHRSLRGDAANAFASSPKKVAKQDKKDSTAVKGESEEEARKRRYYDNR